MTGAKAWDRFDRCFVFSPQPQWPRRGLGQGVVGTELLWDLKLARAALKDKPAWPAHTTAPT